MVKTDCYKCKHMRLVPGDCHIGCAKPDPDMVGNPHGIKYGWFYYPRCFDPIWMQKECCNFELKGSDAVTEIEYVNVIAALLEHSKALGCTVQNVNHNGKNVVYVDIHTPGGNIESFRLTVEEE